jgi:hypothetical protein
MTKRTTRWLALGMVCTLTLAIVVIVSITKDDGPRVLKAHPPEDWMRQHWYRIESISPKDVSPGAPYPAVVYSGVMLHASGGEIPLEINVDSIRFLPITVTIETDWGFTTELRSGFKRSRLKQFSLKLPCPPNADKERTRRKVTVSARDLRGVRSESNYFSFMISANVR